MKTMDPLRWAKFFAATKHGPQQYQQGLPYTHHLAAVEAVLRRYGTDPCRPCFDYTGDAQAILQAAWLHDVVEDTDTKVKEVEEMFGPAVAALVGAVTNEKGDNRKVRAALTYPKIRQAGALAVRLKLADRVANVESGGYLVKMYAREHEDFRRALYTVGESEDLWARLADLFAQAKETAGESLAQAFKDRKTP